MRRCIRCFGALLVLAAFAGSAVGCFERPEEGPPRGYETSERACNDGRDNDRDGRVDCLDTDCVMRNFCGESIPLIPPNQPENTFELCSDGVDNDDNGQFDCGDPKCRSILELCCVAEFNDETCSDGIDNDGNGFADCADFSCRRGEFVTVCDEERACDDGEDNDGDGFTDCDDDDCEDATACVETDCDDGEDNDGDGDADCRDADCAEAAHCAREAPDCDDGIDNDDDGRIDCEEPECQAGAVCRGPENTVARCSDGFDNDGNDFADCEDFSCQRPEPGNPEADALRDLCESSLASCMDGEDNDGDGFVDCNDFSCASPHEMHPERDALLELCASAGESTLEECTDGIDNDGNGFVDCEDRGCLEPRVSERNPFALPCMCEASGIATPELCAREEPVISDEDPGGIEFIDELCDQYVCGMEERPTTVCTDGVDNDDDGFVDCADFSCGGRREALLCDCDGDGTRDDVALTSPCLESGVTPDALDAAGQLLDELERQFGVDIRMGAEEVARQQCMDGVDNDGDGFVDCDDWDCSWNPLTEDLCERKVCE